MVIFSWNMCCTSLGVLNKIILAPLLFGFVLLITESIFPAAPLSSVRTLSLPSFIPTIYDKICTHIAISSSPRLSSCSLFPLTAEKNLMYKSDCLRFLPSITSEYSFSSAFSVYSIVLTGDLTVLTAHTKYSLIFSLVEKHSERISNVYSSLNIATTIPAS